MHIHVHSRTPCLPNTHGLLFIGSDQCVKQDRLSLEHPSPYAAKNSRCPRNWDSEVQNKWKDVYSLPE